jgi:hypothetical protein
LEVARDNSDNDPIATGTALDDCKNILEELSEKLKQLGTSQIDLAMNYPTPDNPTEKS